jgi:hypothetical protein
MREVMEVTHVTWQHAGGLEEANRKSAKRSSF